MVDLDVTITARLSVPAAQAQAIYEDDGQSWPPPSPEDLTAVVAEVIARGPSSFIHDHARRGDVDVKAEVA